MCDGKRECQRESEETGSREIWIVIRESKES